MIKFFTTSKTAFKTLLFSLFLSFFSACTNAPVAPSSPSQPQWPSEQAFLLLPNLKVMQNIHISSKHNLSIQAIIENNKNTKNPEMNIAMMSTTGRRLATVKIQKNSLKLHDISKPMTETLLKSLIEAIQLVLIDPEIESEESVKTLLEWQIKENDSQRNIYFQQQAYAKIVYTDATIRNIKALFNKHQNQYQISIDSTFLK